MLDKIIHDLVMFHLKQLSNELTKFTPDDLIKKYFELSNVYEDAYTRLNTPQKVKASDKSKFGL